MSVLSPLPSVNDLSAAHTSLRATPVSEAQRWAAWHERGKTHDRAVYRRMVVMAPIGVAVVIALAWYLV